ncbi:MAG: SIMPL domain-containing protein [Candidatus Buchananbacteria bacterium]|nr:SIMPL domain-containing protein [Candidatus Buchananbacteria bacterium]
MHEDCCQGERHALKKILMPIVGIVLALLGVYLISLTRNSLKNYDYIGKSPEFKNIITVDGTGKVTAKSDIAIINAGVLTEKVTVAAAQKENTEKMNAIVKSLKDDFKIDGNDIKTSQYNIYPRYDWTNGSQRIIGYSVSQSVEIRVRDFDKIGNILAKAAELGTNTLNGPTFTIDDPEVYKAQAREKAIAQAKEKAKVLADQVGIKLGNIINFSENFGYPIANTYSNDMAFGLGGGTEKSLPAPDIQAGSEEINVTINISYEIR